MGWLDGLFYWRVLDHCKPISHLFHDLVGWFTFPLTIPLFRASRQSITVPDPSWVSHRTGFMAEIWVSHRTLLGAGFIAEIWVSRRTLLTEGLLLWLVRCGQVVVPNSQQGWATLADSWWVTVRMEVSLKLCTVTGETDSTWEQVIS